MSKITITRAEYLQLLGMKMMSDRHLARLNELVDSARAITGEEDKWGHMGDLMFTEDETVDNQLRKLGITVLPETPKPAIAEGWEVEPSVVNDEQAYFLVHATKGRFQIPNESADLIEALLKAVAPSIPQEPTIAN